LSRRRWLAVALVVLLVLVASPFVYAYLSYPAEYVDRVLRWRDADVLDYQKFPERPMEASASPYLFGSNLDEAIVRERFGIAAGTDDLDAFLEEAETQAFIVIQGDEILYERYFNGASRDSIVTSFSTAKSFASALVGIAIAEGHIKAVSDPITDYLPELLERDRAFAEITIEDLLRSRQASSTRNSRS